MVQDLLFTAPFTFLSVMAIIAMVMDALIVNSSRITFIFSAITLLISGILGISTFVLSGIGGQSKPLREAGVLHVEAAEGKCSNSHS